MRSPLCPQRVANPRASVQKQLVLVLKTAVAGVDWHFVSLWLFLSACPPRGGESWPCSLTEGWWRAQIVEVGGGWTGHPLCCPPAAPTGGWRSLQPAHAYRAEGTTGETCTALRRWLQVTRSHKCRRQFKSFCNLLRGYTRCVGNTLRRKT